MANVALLIEALIQLLGTAASITQQIKTAQASGVDLSASQLQALAAQAQADIAQALKDIAAAK